MESPVLLEFFRQGQTFAEDARNNARRCRAQNSCTLPHPQERDQEIEEGAG
jgi:hypothetical protein